MKIIEKLADYKPTEAYRHETFYVKNERLCIEYDYQSFTITDITNGLNARKKCKYWQIYFGENKYADWLFYGDVINGYASGFAEFIEAVVKGGRKALEKVKNSEGYRFYEGEVKGAAVLNPWAKINKQDFTTRITAMKIIKGILNGQIVEAVQKYHLTDDYRADAASNFGENVKLNLLGIVEDLMIYPDHYSKWLDGDKKITLYMNSRSISLKLA